MTVEPTIDARIAQGHLETETSDDPEKGDAKIHPHLKGALRAYAAAHSLITGVYCRACIKLLMVDDPREGSPQPRMYVQTLARHDNTPQPPMVFDRDYVDANSDFSLLIKRPYERVFLCNDLCRLSGYRNSHWEDKPETRKNPAYSATMVWPIRKMLPAAGDTDEAETLGFLCVDTKTRNVFWRRYDFPVGAAFADALYCFIRRWRDKRGSINSLVSARKVA